MYHSTHAYQSTESTENNWKDLRCASQNGFQYTYYLTRITIIIFYKPSLDMLSLRGKYNNISVNGSRMREKERETDRQTDRQTDRDQGRES